MCKHGIAFILQTLTEIIKPIRSFVITLQTEQLTIIRTINPPSATPSKDIRTLPPIHIATSIYVDTSYRSVRIA